MSMGHMQKSLLCTLWRKKKEMRCGPHGKGVNIIFWIKWLFYWLFSGDNHLEYRNFFLSAIKYFCFYKDSSHKQIYKIYIIKCLTKTTAKLNKDKIFVSAERNKKKDRINKVYLTKRSSYFFFVQTFLLSLLWLTWDNNCQRNTNCVTDSNIAYKFTSVYAYITHITNIVIKLTTHIWVSYFIM